MEKVLLFGINGFTGQHFQQYILKNSLSKSFEFIGVDKIIGSQPKIKCLNIDLLDANTISDLVDTEAPDYIINLIGLFQGTDFDSLLTVNAGITQKLLDAIVKTKINVKKVLLIGSAAEYGIPGKLPIKEDAPLHPVNWYGLTKVVQAEYAMFYHRNHQLPVTIARTFNIIGKGISAALSIGGFLERIAKARDGDTIDVGNINTKRDFLDIGDVIDAYWKLLLTGKPGEVYNVCRGASHSIKDILEFLIKISKKSLKVNINKEFFKENEVPDIYGDNSKLKNDTAWTAKINITDALSLC